MPISLGWVATAATDTTADLIAATRRLLGGTTRRCRPDFRSAHRIGNKTIKFIGTVTFGSTTTFGTGGLTVSMPVARNSFGSLPVEGTARFVHGGNIYIGVAEMGTGVSAASIRSFVVTTTGQTASVTSTTPFTWVSGDQITIEGIYEAA